MQELTADIVIVGGGVAGLWALNRLQAQGFKVILLEKYNLGNAQTICSQGIIHGGLKYALTGLFTKDAKELTNMPEIWRQCLQGNNKAEINLTNTNILAEGQYLFSTGSLATNISSFFASKALQSAVETIQYTNYPAILKNPKFTGQVYKLMESILDIPSLIRNLSQPVIENIIKIEDCAVNYQSTNKIANLNLTVAGEKYKLTAQQYIFLAGKGNYEFIGQGLGNIFKPALKAQLRPLHMIYVKSASLKAFPFYAHCIALGPTPRITITTHTASDGMPVWYMGGNLAEDGIKRSAEQQIAIAKQELAHLFPWLQLEDPRWGCMPIDRAEEYQGDGKKPNSATLFATENVQVGWPTKLVLAPLLVRQISKKIQQANMKPNINQNNIDITRLPKPTIACYPWDR